MPGITRTLTFAEGVETTGPTTTFLQTTEFAVYADDATYVSNKGSAAEDGDSYYNSTSDLVRVYANGSWVNYVDLSTAQTLTNKTLTSPSINGANQNMGTASNTNRIVLPNETTANLNGLTDVAGLIAYDSTLSEVSFNDGSGWDQLVNKTGTQTLTNKTLTSPGINGANQNMGNASNTNRIVLPDETTVNLNGLTDVAGSIAYDTTQNKVVFNNGGGWNVLDVPGLDTVVTKTTTYTATTSDNIILCDPSGGAFTITLYAASGNAGRKLTFIKTSSDYTAVTIDGNGSETINGNATTTINTQYERLDIVCDGSNWFIQSRNCNYDWTSSTATVEFNGAMTIGNGSINALEKRTDGNIELSVYMQVGSTSVFGGDFQVKMPTGLTIDTGDVADNFQAILSTVNFYDSSAGNNYQGNCLIDNNSTGYVEAQIGNTGGRFSNSNPVAMGTNDEMWVTVSIPVSGWKSQTE